MGKKSCREILRTTGVEFRSAGVTLRTRWVKFENFDLGSIFLQNFAPMVPKVSLQDFLLVLAALWPKIPIRYFRMGYNHIPIWVLLINGVTNVD